MSRDARNATIEYAEFGADSPMLDLQEGAADMVPQNCMEVFAELFDRLSGTRWFCEPGEA